MTEVPAKMAKPDVSPRFTVEVVAALAQSVKMDAIESIEIATIHFRVYFIG